MDPQRPGHFDKHRAIVKIQDPVWFSLRQIQSDPEHVDIGFSEVHETRAHKNVDNCSKFKSVDPVNRELPPFVADGDGFQSVAGFQLPDKLDHLRKGLRLVQHEFLEYVTREVAILIEDHSVEVFLKRQLAFFIRVKREVMSLIHLLEIKSEFLRGTLADGSVPRVREEHAAYVKEEG